MNFEKGHQPIHRWRECSTSKKAASLSGSHQRLAAQDDLAVVGAPKHSVGVTIPDIVYDLNVFTEYDINPSL